MSNIKNTPVITGIGLATPLGLGREKSWKALVQSKSGVTTTSKAIARIIDLSMPNEARALGIAFFACAEAINDAALTTDLLKSTRTGCIFSASKPHITDNQKLNFNSFINQDSLGIQIANIFGIRGTLLNFSAACATGTLSIIKAAQLVQNGECDIVLAGSAESPLNDLYTAAFNNMGVTTKNLPRPFDKNRDGFALGEGAGALIIESKKSALLRGAKIYGEIDGWNISNSATKAFGATNIKTTSEAINKTLANCSFQIPSYINAHGTATKENDFAECWAIQEAFGSKTQSLRVSSTKAATGHSLGSSGAIEAAFCLLAMRDNVAPPTLNYKTLDDALPNINFVPNTSQNLNIDSALSFSFGFGGATAILALKKHA